MSSALTSPIAADPGALWLPETFLPCYHGIHMRQPRQTASYVNVPPARSDCRNPVINNGQANQAAKTSAAYRALAASHAGLLFNGYKKAAENGA